MTPSHAIFRTVFAECLKVNGNTFDYLPNASASYPFFFVGESMTTEIEGREVMGECTQTVHIYALRTERGRVEELTSLLLDALRTQNAAFEYYINLKTCNPQDLPDNSDVQPLVHRVLDLRFSYAKK